MIELLVVIAIIGILSSIVLASLGTARNKGKDASAKSSIAGVRGTAEIYANTVSTLNYTGLCSDGSITKLTTAANTQTGHTSVCSSTANAYTTYVQLNDSTFYCVDSTGFAGDPSGTGATSLPAGYSPGVKCK